MTRQMNRRTLLKGSAITLAATPLASAARAAVVPGQDEFDYEVTRSEEDWRALLDENEYEILRMGGTEEPKTSPLWNEMRAGRYACKGCDLPVYESMWKVEVDKGWAFFRQSVPNALLMNIDWPADTGVDPAFARFTTIEAHCRRCGSHMGHILLVEDQCLHCINGTSLVFTPEAA